MRAHGPAPMTPPWLHWARGEVGVREIVGPEHESRILRYWQLGRVPVRVTDDETPWCAAFCCAALESTGFRSPRSARARSFAESPNVLRRIEQPILGAFAVYSSTRGPDSGHVHIITGQTPTHFWGIGGNQSNAVNNAPFPRARLIGLFWPADDSGDKRYAVVPVIKQGVYSVTDG